MSDVVKLGDRVITRPWEDFPPPRFVRRPDGAVDSGVDEVLDVLDSVGLFLDGHQELVFDVACSEREDGRWAATQFGWAEPRQNGKSIGLLGRTVAGILLFQEPRIIHSAHEVKTAMESFHKLRDLCENWDVLRQRVKRVINVNGREGIEFYGSKSSGSRVTGGTGVTFIARSKSSGRGFSASTILLDEAQEMSFDVLAAILPVLSAIPNSQLWMCGTPPNNAVMNGEVFTRQRESALRGLSPRQGWIEWGAGPSPEDVEPYDYSDPVNWMRANPACPERIDLESIEDEYNAMDEETFRRDRLGEWDVDGGGSVVPSDVWARQADPDAVTESDRAISIDVSPARTWTSITMAGFSDGRKSRKHVRLLSRGPGTDWVVSAVRELVHETELAPRAVLIDAASPAASLVVPLRRAGVQVTLVQTRDVVAACGQLYDGFIAGTMTHDGSDELTAAMNGSEKRNLMDAWALSRKNSDVDITAFVSATIALYGVTMLKVKRPKIGARGRRKVTVAQ